ncbi:MAG: hypothetical protein Aurels2KO_07400 [Aureliella sp.]
MPAGGQPMTIPSGMSPQQAEAMMKAAQQGRPQVAPNGKPQQPPKGQKPDDKKKEEKPKADGDKEEKPGGPVKRPSEPPTKPDPKELEVTLNDGLLNFQFRNQPWPDVLRWYAEQSNLSFDWQELPGDYINLATQRPYTLEETGDMLNRALLMRGFTLLVQGDVLIVTKVEGINPSLVPRIPSSELSQTPPHTFVRTSFQLNWLLAEQVHAEFASMLSKNGKLTPLQSTNRIEAMDAAANLLDIYNIIQQEQSATALENLAREFVLKHARASSVKQQVEAFLGIASSSGGGMPSSSSARMMQQMQQQMQKQMQAAQQAAARAAQKGGAPGGPPSRPRPDNVYIVANDRSNSVIVHAQPNKMAIIASFIARIDVQNANAADYQTLENRVKVFRLASLDPAELVASLEAMDVLEPQTNLRVDSSNNAIIAYASIADQYIIRNLIERLDGSERSFEVIQLRRLDAESVAGSIRFLMGADEEDSKSNSRSYGYSYYDPWGSRNSQSKKSDDKMRVGANVQDNQVLLWVNAIEMEEIQNLLVKLGEIPPDGGSGSRVRVVDASRQPETYEYLQRLKEEWERSGRGTINIPDASEFAPPKESEQPDSGDDDAATSDGGVAADSGEAAPVAAASPAN